MHKRLYVVGAVAGVVLLGGVWAAGLIPPDSGASPDVAAVAAATAATPVPIDAVAFDASTAKVTNNDEYGSTLRDANGVLQTKVSLVPVQVKRDGAWIPASNVVT